MKLRPAILTLLGVSLVAISARAETVRNGNELALNYSRADAPGKAALRKEAEGRLFTFRYLRVVRVETNAAGSVAVYHAVEPSSDLAVEIHPQVGGVTRQIAATVATNDCLAVNGRLTHLDNPPGTLVVDPAVLRSKDRSAPKCEKELLPEFDPNAVKE